MDQHVFAFLLIIEGTTEKVLQFIMQLKSIYHKNLGFIEQKMSFETIHSVSNKKKSSLSIDIFSTKKKSYDFFKADLYRLMLVFNKDALFHLVSGLIPSPKKVAYKKDASLFYPSFKDEEEEMFLL
jgi:hypothetical protein